MLRTDFGQYKYLGLLAGLNITFLLVSNFTAARIISVFGVGVVLDQVAEDSMKELRPRWINRLAGVDVWLESQVRAAILYVRWDDKVS